MQAEPVRRSAVSSAPLIRLSAGRLGMVGWDPRGGRILCASCASTTRGSGLESDSPAAAETLEIWPISVVLETDPASRTPTSLDLCFRLAFRVTISTSRRALPIVVASTRACCRARTCGHFPVHRSRRRIRVQCLERRQTRPAAATASAVACHGESRLRGCATHGWAVRRGRSGRFPPPPGRSD